ncbi:MAG: T9SS type A sorting domain-containing protein, partial [Bacteroidetes bacterium]|nr:T9SS type A sorting domain-containing protein [Bacteroidota bacterium]
IEQETVLPNAMVRDVMVANPHTAKSQVLLDMLDERFDPMPDYMKAQILAGRSIQNLKQELESQLAGHKLRKAKAMNAIIRYYREELEDPVAASDSLLALYQADNTLKSSYRLVWLYFERGEYQLGENVINNIPNQFTLTEDGQQGHVNLAGIYTMLSGLYENGNTIDSLSENQVAELQTLASEGTIPARAYARNILMTLGELEYEEPILHPDPFKSSQAIEAYNELLAAEAPQQLNVYPNPSTGYVILEYKLDTEADGTIEIKDVAGRPIHTVTTTGKQDQVTVVTKDWKPGIYIATLKLNGKSTESVKFTLVK